MHTSQLSLASWVYTTIIQVWLALSRQSGLALLPAKRATCSAVFSLCSCVSSAVQLVHSGRLGRDKNRAAPEALLMNQGNCLQLGFTILQCAKWGGSKDTSFCVCRLLLNDPTLQYNAMHNAGSAATLMRYHVLAICTCLVRVTCKQVRLGELWWGVRTLL